MRRVWLISLVLFLATFAVFSRVLLADFVQWDDDISVSENPHIQGLDWARLRWMFSDASYALRYKPLTWLTYALIHQVGGLHPFGYHLANLFLHCSNTVLSFLVLRRLLAAGVAAQRTNEALAEATIPAAGGALLWAFNPLRVEPVARITDLTFCLQLSFLLVSLLCYLRSYSSAGEDGRRLSYSCAVGAFGLAMFTYPSAFAFGVLLLVLDWYPLRRFENCSNWRRDARAQRALLEKIPFLLLGGTMLTTVVARLYPKGNWAGAQLETSFDLFQRSMQAFYVWIYYAWRPWAPFHLSPVYTTLVQFSPNAWPFWASAALVIGTTVLLVRRRNQWPWALALWASHLVLLVPVLGLTERPHYTADRYDYLPGLVWAVATAAALSAISRRPNLCFIGIGLALALAVFWGSLSWRQSRVWRDSVALFQYTIHRLRDDPYRSDIQWRLGAVLASAGKTEEAVQQFGASLHIHPTPEAYLGFADLLEKTGDRQGALTNSLAALALDVTPLNRVQAGRVLAGLGLSAEAISQYRMALASVPDLTPALNNLAWILASDCDATNRNGSEAVQLAERACAITDYRIPLMVGTLAAAYAEAGKFSEAIAAGQKARDLAEAAGKPDVAEKNRQLLELYRSGRPYHEGKPEDRNPKPEVNPSILPSTTEDRKPEATNQ